MTPIWTPADFTDTVQAANAESEYAGLTDQMRTAAALLEKLNRLYAIEDPTTGEWSPTLLRDEADRLDRPIMGEISQ